ncbi:MAG: electron transfer flavoprotein subunit beta/FixA family protein [Mucilaginibacter polytrichastri]|nr:electron transfer flavoprotein subunit beta/FixA family protein [Mucilaginibacter polytrichastri]
MKILVCISQVPDTTTKITFTDDNTRFNTQGVQFILNPYDEIALSRAVDLAAGGGSVTVIHVGEASADATIRKALAVGADNAVRINAQPENAYFVAYQIAEYVKEHAFDLILTGRESIDYNGSKVAAMLGEMLDIPSVSIIKKLDVNGQEVTVEREIEGGKEVLTIPLPVVAGTAEGVAEWKIPNMRGIMSARTKPLDVVEAKALETSEKYLKYETPAPRGQVKLVSADEVGSLIELLHNEAKVI